MVKPHYDIPDWYEPEIMNVVEHFVRPGDCAVDVGASVGFFTRMCSQLVGPRGSVFAFEPNLESFEHLERNVKKHNLENVQIFQKALWSSYLPELILWSVEEIGYTSICRYINPNSTSEVVEAITLDSILPVCPRFMKIDCELAEFEVLKGAENILRRGVDCVVLEFNYHLMQQNNLTDHTIRDYMADLGYDMFLINIGRQDKSEGFVDPVKVNREVEIEVKRKDIHHINVMFSTEKKVRELWKTTKTETAAP